ncbi:MAG: tetratricopeptide repeat protein, partial [Candidatus Poribacteria bacterium]
TINTAIQYWQQALVIAREMGDRRDEANQLIRLGAILCNCGWMQKGLEYLHRGLSISREIEDKQTESIGLSNLGDAFFCGKRELQQAIEYHRQALEIARNIVFPHNEGYSLNSLGMIYCTRRQYQLALACFMRAAAVWRAISDPQLNEAEHNIKNLRKQLGEMYFAAVEAQVKTNMATYLQQATGIADWTDEEVFINGNV